MRLLADEIARRVGGELRGENCLVGPDAVIDSRLATPGALFIAVPGEQVDGHDYLAAAAEQGAVAALAGRECPTSMTQILVPDQIAALSLLARSVVDDSSAQIVAVTGSSGKTSTKDLIAQILSAAGPTVFAKGSRNNEIGLPLTVLGLTEETKHLVLEMGARGQGHVAWLCSIAPPQIGVVTNVGSAHLGEFGSVQAIAQAKGELVAAASDWAVLNADDPAVWQMRERAQGQVAGFSLHQPAAADYPAWATNLELGPNGQTAFDLNAPDGITRVSLALPGQFQVYNALAAAAVGLISGLSLDAVSQGLSAARQLSPWRMEMREAGAVTVVNDAYNANPDSMRAALTAVADLAGKRRIVAVLGDMLELGSGAAAVHEEIGSFAAQKVTELVAVGDFAPALTSGFGGGHLAADAAAATETVNQILRPGDVILVKASRGLGLEKVANAIVSTRGE